MLLTTSLVLGVSMRFSTNYAMKSIKTSNSNKVTVSGSSNAVNGTQELRLQELLPQQQFFLAPELQALWLMTNIETRPRVILIDVQLRGMLQLQNGFIQEVSRETKIKKGINL